MDCLLIEFLSRRDIFPEEPKKTKAKNSKAFGGLRIKLPSFMLYPLRE